jgi:hypothetical protein
MDFNEFFFAYYSTGGQSSFVYFNSQAALRTSEAGATLAPLNVGCRKSLKNIQLLLRRSAFVDLKGITWWP